MQKSFRAKRLRGSRVFFRYAWMVLLGLTIPAVLGMYNRKVDVGEGYHRFYTFPNDNAGPVFLAYGEDGFLHKLISPHTLGGTLSLTNKGDAVKIRMRMAGVPDGLTIHWGNGHTRDFNPETTTVDRVLRRGDKISVHHTYHIGENLRNKPVIFSGDFVVSDADSGNTLLTVPIRIQRAGTAPRPEMEDTGHVH
ncbi:MAG: hypothetical protein P8Z37_07580 [Acidobacteriota bacterium]